jgi:two-component sensor histidine kinase
MIGAWDESDRMAALRRYEILDSAEDADFSDFLQIASDICDAPIAAINLIDSDRHWSLAGLNAGARQLPLSQSICAQAIRQAELFVVTDLSVDARFLDNPLVVGEPKLRFYAGALLETPAGLPIGTMCVMDCEPRRNGLSPRQAFTLKALARQIIAQLELRRTTREVTSAASARAKLQASLHEKEALLREVHHRVKNNLQLISSLLSLQAARIADPGAASLFADSRNRVRSMALVHENLYRAGNFAEIAMREHIVSLCGHLAKAYSVPRIAVIASSDDIAMGMDRAISCGLIVNELVSNALKHAFPNERAGTVRVSFERKPPGEFVLTVADDGVGLASDIEPGEASSLGMQLVQDLVDQLQADITVERLEGTRIVVTFSHP